MSKTKTVDGVVITTTESPVKLSRLYIAEFQKVGSQTAEIKQVITTISAYPSKRVETNLQENLFAPQEFGYQPQIFTQTETRVAWLDVPVTMTKEQIEQRLADANKTGAVIYKILSHEPILDSAQKHNLSVGNRTMDYYANVQVVRYPANAKTEADGTAGQIVKDRITGLPLVQYRRTLFFKTPHADIDMRDNTKQPYMSAEIAAELEGASAMAGQTI